MATNFKSAILAVVGFVLVGLGSAQVPKDSPEYVEPVERQWDEGQCYSKMVEALYNGTDITDTMQDKHMIAAEAYRLLDVAGQRCA